MADDDITAVLQSVILLVSDTLVHDLLFDDCDERSMADSVARHEKVLLRVLKPRVEEARYKWLLFIEDHFCIYKQTMCINIVTWATESN